MSQSKRKAIRERVLDRDGHACVYCGVSLIYTLEPSPCGPDTFLVHGQYPTLDHDVPRCRGGGHGEDNLVACCISCNSQKRMMTGEEYRVWRKERGL